MAHRMIGVQLLRTTVGTTTTAGSRGCGDWLPFHGPSKTATGNVRESPTSVVLIVCRGGADHVRRRRSAATCGSARTHGRLLFVVGDGIPQGSPDRVRLPVCLYLRRSLRSATDRRIGASCSSGIVQALGATSLILAGIYFWFPDADHRPRRLPDRRRCSSSSLVVGWRLAFEWLTQPGRAARAAAAGRHQRRPRSSSRASCTSGARSSASRSSASSIPIRRASARRYQSRRRSARSTTFRRSSARASVDRVVVSLADARGKLPMDKLLEMRLERRDASITWRRSTRNTPARSRSRTCVRAG